MTLSDEIAEIANSLIVVDVGTCERLHRIARDVAVLERALDDLAVDAQRIERMSRPLRPVGEIIEPLLERALRLSSQEKL